VLASDLIKNDAKEILSATNEIQGFKNKVFFD
jgi:hypothetical protein